MKNNLVFVDKFIKNNDKTEKEIKLENIIDLVENYQIECEMQIQFLKTGEIPKIDLEIKKASNVIKKAKSKFETSRFSTQEFWNFEYYINNRNDAKRNLEEAENNLLLLKEEKRELQLQLKEFQSVLADLTATVK